MKKITLTLLAIALIFGCAKEPIETETTETKSTAYSSELLGTWLLDSTSSGDTMQYADTTMFVFFLEIKPDLIFSGWETFGYPERISKGVTGIEGKYEVKGNILKYADGESVTFTVTDSTLITSDNNEYSINHYLRR